MKRMGLMLALLVMLMLPASAQDATTVTVGKLELALPTGWYIPESDYQSFYAMNETLESVFVAHDTGLEALLVSPDKVAELVPNSADLSQKDILVELATLAYDMDIKDGEFFTVDLGAVDGTRWFYGDTESLKDDVLQGDLYLIPLQAGGYLFADIYTYQSYFVEDVDALESAMEDLFISAGAALLKTDTSTPDSGNDNGTSSELPEGWSVAEADYESFYVMNDGFEPTILLHESGLEALLVSPDKVAELVPNAADLTYQDLLVELATLSYDLDIKDEEFFTVDLGAIDGLRWTYDNSKTTKDEVVQGDLYIIPLTDGGYLYADIYAFQSYFEEGTDALEQAMEALFISKGAALIEESGS